MSPARWPVLHLHQNQLQSCATGPLDKPEAIWKQILGPDELEKELFGQGTEFSH